jgi:hypothetical protein
MLIDRAGEPWQEPETSYRLDSISELRNRVGNEQFDRAYAAGNTLSVNAALNLALGRSS